MRFANLFIPSVALLVGCGINGIGPASVRPDTNWIGETRITAGDTEVMLCENGKHYNLTGPAVDTIYQRYHGVNTRGGQWMKLWVTGHLGVTTRNGNPDSALYAATFLHLDGALHCDPVPNATMAGTYRVDIVDPIRTRSLLLLLFPEGDATMITDLRDGQALYEEDGRWGTDSDDHVKLEFLQRNQAMTFRYADHRLISEMPGPGNGFIFDGTGPPDRLQGAFGRTARWFAAVGTAQGRPLDLATLRPTTAIAEIFPTDKERDALRASARDTLALDDTRLRLEWGAVSTMRDAVSMMRMHMRVQGAHR